MFEKLKAALAASTPGKWFVREHTASKDSFFVQAPRLDPSHPYDIEVLGEDDTLYPTRRGDADFIAQAHNSMPLLLEAVELVALISRMETEDEINEKTDDAGMSGDDACETVSGLVESSRKIMEKLK